MSDFVYDGLALPSGKTDSRPLTGPAAQAVTAAEWNRLCQAVADLRDAVLAGDYSGLIDNPDAPVSGATGVRMRNDDGVLQVSEGGVDYRRAILGKGLHVEDYGAAGDGTTDDTTTIQNAIDDAMELGIPLYFDAKTYKVTRMLNVNHGENGFRMIGVGRPIASIQTKIVMSATTTQRAVISVFANACLFDCIVFDANRTAKYGMFFQGSNFTTVRDCTATRGLKAGFYLPRRTNDTDVPESGEWLALKQYVVPDRRVNSGNIYECISAGTSAASGGPTTTSLDITDGTVHWKYISAGVSSGAATINDSNTFENCWGTYNGTYYYSSGMRIPEGAVSSLQPGTVAVATGVAEIVGTGTTFLSMGLRMGDFVCVGTDIIDPSSQFFQVESVTDDTHIVLNVHAKLPTATVSGQRYAVGVGAGYQEQISGDNNVNAIRKGLFRFNNGAGLILAGLTGAHVDHPQIDYHPFYGICAGCAVNGQSTYSTKLTAPYMEANLVAHILFSGCLGVHLDTPEWASGWYIAQYLVVGTNSGIITGQSGAGGAIITDIQSNQFTDIQTTVGATYANGGFLFLGDVTYRVLNMGSIAAGVSLLARAAAYSMGGAGDITFTATPTIEAGRTDGQVIRLRNDSTGFFKFQDNGTLANSKLDLRGLADLSITPGGTAQFSWKSTGAKWVLDWSS